MHIAAAFKKEVYSIWGNTIPAFGMYPYRTSLRCLKTIDLVAALVPKLDITNAQRTLQMHE